MNNKPKIIFVFAKEGSATSTKYGGFAARLKKTEALTSYDLETIALENLAYYINEDGSAAVIDTKTNSDIKQASLVYLKSWQSMPNEAAALANYLLYQGVVFADTLALGKGTSKIVTLFRQWGSGVRVPNTLYAARGELLIELLDKPLNQELLQEPFILKDAEGAKGKLNFLVSFKEAKEIIAQHPEVRFVCQRFVPNDGDYRVGVYGGKARFILHRVGNGTTHLNNTSTGGVGTLLSTRSVSKNLLTLAEKAARASELEVAGVDVIQDKGTKRWYVLEVNQGSQIVTGAFTEENKELFGAGIAAMVKNRKARARSQPRKVIGRRTIAKLPDLKISKVVAKVDTGAYTSTLHAENIRVESTQSGQDMLTFDVVPTTLLSTNGGEVITVTTPDFFVQKVRSSNGHVQHRYSIRTRVSIEKRIFSAVITLSDRSEMGFPLLVGRRLLRSRFIVNVELDEDNQSEWKY